MPSLARCIALSLLFAAAGAHAAPWTYRGTLNDGGAPANGRYDIRLSVLDAGGVKSLVYPLTFSGVEVKDGAFAVDVDFGIDLGELGAVKLKTEVAQGGSGFVALGEPQAFDATAALVGVCWDTQGNAGTNPATDFLGTTDGQKLVLRANNAMGFRLEPTPSGLNLVGGASVNTASAGFSGQVIAGGGSSASDCGLIGLAPCTNLTQASFATVSGGRANRAIEFASVVAGGESNDTTGFYSVVAGGKLNKAQNHNAAVGGGAQNIASGNAAAVSGGLANRAVGDRSSVVGGEENEARARSSVVLGGFLNCAGGEFSAASGQRAIVRSSDTTCGSSSGDANGDEGTFVWADSQASNFVSTGPNQFLVRADGGVGINGTPATASLEMNVFGATPFDGFVEMSLIPKPSLNGNTGERVEFGVGKGGAGANDADLRIAHRNDSGAFFEHLSIDGDGSVIVRSNPANTAQGVQLAIGAGAWSTLSDRNLKTDIQSILPLDVLERLVAMPIQQWRYIGQPGEVQHIGPMAQDFAAAFGVGENDTTISTVDADGVALAAIQGLNQKLEAELTQSRAENAGLQEQLRGLQEQSQQLAARLAALEAAGER